MVVVVELAAMVVAIEIVMVLVLVHCNALINRQVLEQLVACRFLAQDLHVVVMCATVVLVLGQVLTVLGS